MNYRPVIVLVEPQLGQNIGACARAMLNCGLEDLRLVRPRDEWPNRAAKAAATGAGRVVDQARLYESTAEAISDLQLVLATTARHRESLKEVIPPDQAALRVHAAALRGERAGLLFGPERTGLENEDLALATSLVEIPVNPEFNSLNLGQAVLLVGWEWYRTLARPKQSPVAESTEVADPDQQRAQGDEMVNLFEHLEQELDAAAFFRVPEKRGRIIRNLRNLLQRAQPRRHEVRTLHGVIAALSGRRKDGSLARLGAGQRPGSESE